MLFIDWITKILIDKLFLFCIISSKLGVDRWFLVLNWFKFPDLLSGCLIIIVFMSTFVQCPGPVI